MLAEPGYHTRAFVEWESWPRSVLIAAQRAGYFAPAPIWTDLRSFDARPFRGAFDAILMDVMMPEMNGYEATRAIRLCDKPDAADVPIIATTANAFTEDVAQAKESGMNDHLSKPIEIEKLKATLAKYRVR